MEIAARLRSIDVDPASITFIINSHFHIDHCGGNATIPNATVVAQAREQEAAKDATDVGLFDPQDFATGHPVLTINGDHDLFGDGSVRIIPTPGHTPGHQSVIVKLPKGDVLLAGDCCYTQRNLDQMTLPGLTADKEAGMATLGQLVRLRAGGTHIIFGHDGLQWATIKEGVPLSV
jgi:N-acyl homoserine lactone hydrolase